MEKKYDIIPFEEDRFAIIDLDGKIIDNAQGYGYKSEYSAHKVFGMLEKPGSTPFHWKILPASFLNLPPFFC